MSGTTRTGRRPGFDPDELAALEEERDFLLRSIRDLDAEFDAGDLDTADYETLRDEYTARAAETLRAIRDGRRAMEENRRPRSIGRTLGILAGVAVFAVLAGFLVARTMGARGIDDSATGTIGSERTPNQRAQDCQQLLDPADPDPAVECFQDVLDDDPRNVLANTWMAWQLELAGGDALDDEEKDHIESLIEAALAQRPDYGHALAFRAIIAFRHDKPEDAARYLDEFEATNPGEDVRAVIESFDLRARIEEAVAVSGPDRDAVRCRSLIDPQDPIGALRCFQDVLDEDPDNVIANTWIAFQLEQTIPHLPATEGGRARERVEEYLDHALSVAPEDPYALALRAIVAWAHDDPETARSVHDRFLAVDPPEEARKLVEESGLVEILDEADA